MFGLGMPEILLILAIALIVIGPQKLPEVAKTLGKAMGEFKRSAQDLKNSIDIETTVNESKSKPKSGKKKLRDAIKDIGTEASGQGTDSEQPQESEKTDPLEPDDTKSDAPKAKPTQEPAQDNQESNAPAPASSENQTATSKE